MDKHTADKAIIMAAGIGKRMQPLTLKTPKPLVKVNGIRMIDTVVSALRKNGINRIYVVVGYLKEQFYDWAKGEDEIELIENPWYDSCNNISSLYAAREHLGNCIILDGDQIIYNPDILEPHFELSGYNAVWCDDETDEWLMDVDEEGIVKSCSRNGGKHGWQLYSISRWSLEDGERLKKHLEYEWDRENRDIYWDDVAMFEHFEEYRLGIKKMDPGDVIEIDSLEELAEKDKKYEESLKQREDK